MRQFYLTYPEEEICYTLCSKLSWSHNRLIMRVQDSNARHYYLTEAAQEGWSVRALERNIESHYYQRMLSAPGGEEECNVALHTSSAADTATMDVKSFVKDPYVLEFVGLPPYPDHKESQLEEALADNMQQFLLELGKGFSFVGRQYLVGTGQKKLSSKDGKFVSFEMTQFDNDEIVSFEMAQIPSVLFSTGWTNHQIIMNRCKTNEERLFYMLCR